MVRNKAGLPSKLAILAVALLLVCTMGTGARSEGAPEGEKEPTFLELTQQLMRANQDMYNRDRTGDQAYIFLLKGRFVSDQDVQALMNVLAARKALQEKVMADSTDEARIAELREAVIEPDEEFAREFLFSEMLLQAKADEMGITDLDKSVIWYKKEGWLLPEPPAPDVSDTEALLRRGWIRLQMLRNDLMSVETTEPPYEGSAARIEELIRTLKLSYTATER